MFKFSYNVGSGTKDDPFRIPFVPFGNLNTNNTQPAIARVEMSSDNGNVNDIDLYVVGFGTSGGFSEGQSNKKLTDGILTLDVDLAVRTKFEGTHTLMVSAVKYAEKVNGYNIRGKSEWDENYPHPTAWGRSLYYFAMFTEEEQKEWEAKFAPKPEPVVTIEPVILKNDDELTVSDVVDNLDDFDLTELQELVDLLEDRLNQLKGAVEVKAESEIKQFKGAPVEEAVDEYTPEYQDGVNFVVSHEWLTDTQFVLNVALENVKDYAPNGFSSFQFDVPFVFGTDYLELSTKDTYFEGVKENTGEADIRQMITGWTYRGFENHPKQKVRVAGFASSLNSIKYDYNLIKLVYDVVDPAFDQFVFDFKEVRVNGLSTPINPKNPRHIVTK